MQLISDISFNQSLNNFSTMYYHNAPTLVSLYEGEGRIHPSLASRATG